MSTPAAPPVQPRPPQVREQDRQHLKVLSILYYVHAGIMALFGCGSVIYVAGGIVLILFRDELAARSEELPPEMIGFFGAMTGMIGVVTVAVQWLLAAGTFFCGRFLAAPRHRTCCLVVAAITCLSVPFGTALGVYSFFVLTRPGVEALFRAHGR